MLIALIVLYIMGCFMAYFWAVEDTDADEPGVWIGIIFWPIPVLLLMLLQLIDAIRNRFFSPKQ